jgi:hypothetical protein
LREQNLLEGEESHIEMVEGEASFPGSLAVVVSEGQ